MMIEGEMAGPASDTCSSLSHSFVALWAPMHSSHAPDMSGTWSAFGFRLISPGTSSSTGANTS